MTERPVHIILDTSAIIACTRGSVDVGETLSEIDDERGAVGLPVLSLVEAGHRLTDTGWLDLLLEHRATAILDLNGSDWPALAAMYRDVEHVDAASAALAAIDHRCPMLTARPRLYETSGVVDYLISLPPETSAN
ncbi:PIN domain-containing protein [Jidongwangia harbinensis]|uniref:PIN domain-containing protein n=1 Tax=Jidongwangia harbinensis TaxID=2878561 RepID=UPI001CD9DA49|nr:PIN domain-containing protein [Jidongwangia harbinensis]MCA2214453.1 hypothetical protein [Jidongwangia harbinensis]